MKACLLALALCVGAQCGAAGLDAEKQRLADRYLAILMANPMQETAFDRLWKIHAETGQIEALISACEQRKAEAPVLYARVLQRANRSAEAQVVLGEVANTGNAVAAEMLAGILEEEGNIHTAAEVIEKAAAAQESPGLLVHLGEIWQRAGELEKSRDAWKRAVALDPVDLGLRKRLAAASAQADEWEEAVSHLEVIAKHGSPTERFSAWSEISQRLEVAGEIERAISAQEALLGLMGPGHWQLNAARLRLLNLYDKNHSLPALERKWREEAEAYPRDPQRALRMAKLYEFQGDDLQQRDWLTRASTLLPKDLRLACQVAALDLSLGNPESAATRYDKVLAARPEDADVIFLRAEVSALMGQEADAEKRIENFLSSHPNEESAHAKAVDFYRRMRLSAPLERKLAAAFSSRPDDLQAVSDLAQFYLGQRRDAQAADCLSRFEGSRLDSKEAAAAAFRFSELLKGSGIRTEAVRWARQAFENDPSAPEYALHLADLLQADGQTEAMVDVLRKACEVSKDSLPREDVERRLFLALQSGTYGEERAKPAKPAVQEMIKDLNAEARQTGSDVPWLRLARWLRWAEAQASPLSALRNGLEAVPQSTALQEELADEFAALGDVASAIAAFKRLKELVPERATEIQRQIGHLELDRGNIEEALRIFHALANESKDWQSLADVALAQQMSGNWFEAFETWQRAHSLASPDARRSLRTPILNAATRLQLFTRGLDFLENACAAAPNTPARKELLDEAATYAVAQGVAEEWRSRIERRARTAADERLWRECLASLLLTQGKEEEALQTVKAAVIQQGDGSVEEIDGLIKLAEKADDWDEAARLARRIVLLVGTQDPAPSIRYAGFLERAGRRDEVENIWHALAARHARNPQLLSAAGDFFERIGKIEQAESSYRVAARFSGCAPQVFLRLGQFALERGDRSQALSDFEMLLSHTRPQPSGYEDCIPLPERILRIAAQPPRTGGMPAVQWKLASDSHDQGCRLIAIREAGRLLAHSPRRQQWFQGFSEQIERVWAAYYSEQNPDFFVEVQRLTSSENTSTALEQGFAALILEQEDEKTLGHWASDPRKRQDRWENLLAALSRMLEANWRPSSEFLTRLFAHAPALTRRRAAQFLAQKNLLREACALGETVPDTLPASQACSAWIELAQWWIALCDPDAAIARLDKAIECAPSSISFSEPLFAALRGRWLLTPQDQRSAFEADVTSRLKTLKVRKCERAAAALIASLQGADSDAAEKLVEVFHDLGNSDNESWSELVQQGGNQLEEWNLHRLARDVYRNDLARDSALLTLRGENFGDATIGRFVLNQLLSADGEQIPYLLNEWLARGASDRELLDAVLRLQHSGRVESAVLVYKTLCERNPRNEGIRSGILNLVQVRLLQEPGVAFFERLLAEEYPSLGRAMFQTAGIRLAAILEEQGNYERSLALLSRLGRDGPLNKALLLRQVQTLCKLGRHREALHELERSPFLAASAEFTPPAVELYAAFGREREAFALLERDIRSGPPRRKAAVARLRELAGLVGDDSRIESAKKLLEEDLPITERNSATQGDWTKVLTEIENVAPKAEERFRALRNFLLVQQTMPAPFLDEQISRLKRMASRNPELLPEYYLLRKELAQRLGSTDDLLKELFREWNSGRGNTDAGEIIVQILSQQKRYGELGRMLDDYLVESHFNERAWDQIGKNLLAANQYGLAVRTFSELAKRMPSSAPRALALAQALVMTGKSDAAEAITSPIKRIALFNSQRNIDLAEYYVAVGRATEAIPYLLAAPGDARTGEVWIKAMEQFLQQKNFSSARDCITRAVKTSYTFPARTLADYYWQSAELDRLNPERNEFGLPGRQFRELQIEIARRLVSQNDLARAWPWVEKISFLVDDSQGRNLLQSVESSDWDRAASLWESAESPLWEARCGMAQFLLRRAAASDSQANVLKDLSRAHQLHPGSFAIAQVYVGELLRSQAPSAARKVLQEVIDAYARPEDRRRARQMLTSLQLSPALP